MDIHSNSTNIKLGVEECVGKVEFVFWYLDIIKIMIRPETGLRYAQYMRGIVSYQGFYGINFVTQVPTPNIPMAQFYSFISVSISVSCPKIVVSHL
jgi:hypothetical protein